MTAVSNKRASSPGCLAGLAILLAGIAPVSIHSQLSHPGLATPIALSHAFTVVICGPALAAGHPAIPDLRVVGDGNTRLSASAFASTCQAAVLALAELQRYGRREAPSASDSLLSGSVLAESSLAGEVCFRAVPTLPCFAALTAKVSASESYSPPDCASEAGEFCLPEALSLCAARSLLLSSCSCFALSAMAPEL